MELETAKKIVPAYRIENMRKATEARLQKARERKAMQVQLEIKTTEFIAPEKKLDNSIVEYEKDSNVAKLKDSFYSVFNELGGADGMAKWAKKDPKHRMEYYKLFVGLLKAESVKQAEGQKQQVVVNIVCPGEETKPIMVEPRG